MKQWCKQARPVVPIPRARPPRSGLEAPQDRDEYNTSCNCCVDQQWISISTADQQWITTARKQWDSTGSKLTVICRDGKYDLPSHTDMTKQWSKDQDCHCQDHDQDPRTTALLWSIQTWTALTVLLGLPISRDDKAMLHCELLYPYTLLYFYFTLLQPKQNKNYWRMLCFVKFVASCAEQMYSIVLCLFQTLIFKSSFIAGSTKKTVLVVMILVWL